jgi:LysR family transcriptional regulator for metE and metH
MHIEIRHLRLVEVINDEGGVTKAAGRLHLTQPAVSHALNDLEQRLGVKLFRRESRGMVPTAEGSRLLRTARCVLDEVQEVERALAMCKTGGLGVLRLATECYTCYHWLPQFLKSFLRDYPGIDVRIVPQATRDPIAAILADELDLAIMCSEPERQELITEPLFTDEMVAIVAPEHRLASRRYLEAADFAGEHLVVHSNPGEGVLFTQILDPAGVRPKRMSELQLTEAVVETVKAGLGIAVLAHWAVARELSAGSLAGVQLTSDGLHRTWYAAMLRRRTTGPELEALVECLKQRAFPSIGAAPCFGSSCRS